MLIAVRYKTKLHGHLIHSFLFYILFFPISLCFTLFKINFYSKFVIRLNLSQNGMIVFLEKYLLQFVSSSIMYGFNLNLFVVVDELNASRCPVSILVTYDSINISISNFLLRVNGHTLRYISDIF